MYTYKSKRNYTCCLTLSGFILFSKWTIRLLAMHSHTSFLPFPVNAHWDPFNLTLPWPLAILSKTKMCGLWEKKSAILTRASLMTRYPHSTTNTRLPMYRLNTSPY